MKFVDGSGCELEVIELIRDGCRRAVIRATWDGVHLIGKGYYDDPDEVVKLIDAESVVEVLEFPQK